MMWRKHIRNLRSAVAAYGMLPLNLEDPTMSAATAALCAAVPDTAISHLLNLPTTPFFGHTLDVLRGSQP